MTAIRKRLAPLGALAAGVAQEMSDPLTVLVSGLDEVLRQVGPEEPARQPLLELDRAARACAAITWRLQCFSRTIAPEIHPLRLETLLSEAEARLLG